ncbi:MAG: DUF5666 domain-containing protein [Thermodesulfobacteriota bacterium]
MKTNRILGGLSVLAIFLVMISCGGGSTANSGGGVGGSGIISRGSISEFGSIIVNGTEFDTISAIVLVNGETVGTGDAAVQSYLDEGKVVTVKGTIGEDEESAVAERVIYRSEVEGPISNVSGSGPDERQLEVMGQTVMVNFMTNLHDDFDLDDIALNMVVEVSGFYDDQGTVWATFLEEKGTYLENTLYEVKGFVEALDDPQPEMFQINGLNVSYASADMSGLPDGLLENGMLVEAIGKVDAAFTLMLADQVALEDDLEFENAEEVEVMGFVTAKAAADEFTVGSQVVMVEDGAVFVDGVQIDIVPGVKLEAEGELVDGILWAYEIEFWEPDQFEIEGLVTDFVSESEFTVDGQIINTTPETVFEDGEPSDLANGINVEIKGRADGDVMVADKVSFELGDI